MTSLHRHELCTQQLIEKSASANPLVIAETLHMEIRVEELPSRVMAMYVMIGERCFAVLNESHVDEDFEKYMVALCLYYHLNKRPRILLLDGPVDGDMSAGYFAQTLLAHGTEPIAGETSAEFDKRAGIPNHISDLAKRRLH